MGKKNDIVSLTSDLQNPEIREEMQDLQNFNPAEKSMLAIMDLFNKQIYRGKKLAEIRDLALGRLEEKIDEGQMSTRELIETVRVTSEMEVNTAKSVFDLVKPSGANGVNIFMNPEGVTGIPSVTQNIGTDFTKSGSERALENKKIAAFNAFMDVVSSQEVDKDKE